MKEKPMFNTNKTIQEEKRWCKKHPTSRWGKKRDGAWFDRCVIGQKLNQDCEIGKDE